MDVKDWGAFVRGRWDWSRGGYENGFPRGCQFTDVDAAVEFDGRALVIEAKHFDGIGMLPPLSEGQKRFLKDEASRGKTVFALWGCGPCNDPWAIKNIGTGEFHDWRTIPDKLERRQLLKQLIDQALGLNCEAA